MKSYAMSRLERSSDTVAEFHIDPDGKRWAVWYRVGGNRLVVQIVTHGVTIYNGRPYNRLGAGTVLRLTDISSLIEISELPADDGGVT